MTTTATEPSTDASSRPRCKRKAHKASGNGTTQTKPEHPGPGRPTIYTPELGAEICELTAMRVPLVRICERAGMPSERTVYAWKRKHDFLHEYARAREHRADARADRIDEIAEELRTGKLDAPTARTLFDVERWQAGREKPGVYGDRVSAELAGPNGGPLQIEATAAVKALLEALPELMNSKVLDALPVPAEGGNDATQPAG